MSDLKENIKKLLLFLKEKGYDRRRIEQELGLAENSIDQNLARGGTKKLETSLDLLKKSILQNAIFEVGFNQGGKKEEKNDTAANPSLQSLIASNDKLAQANLTLADAHKIIAQNNEVLIGRLKATGENVSDNPLGHPDVLSRLLEVLAELGEGKLWKTKADGLIQLGNALSVPGFAGENKEGNRVAVGKKSTAGKAQA